VLQGILLARLLGPVGRGEFATVILWPNVFAGLGILGVNMALARFAGQGQDPDGLVKTAVKAALVTGALTALVCGVALPFLLPEGKHNLLPAAYLFLLFIPINHLGMNLQGVDHGVGNFRWLNGTRALLYPVFFTGVLLCWWLATDTVFWVAVALLIANGSVVLIRLAAKLKSLLGEGQGVSFKTLCKKSYPFVVASIIAILYTQMDKALLVWLLAPEEIGWYVAAFAAAGSCTIPLRSTDGLHGSITCCAPIKYRFPSWRGPMSRWCPGPARCRASPSTIPNILWWSFPIPTCRKMPLTFCPNLSSTATSRL